jgi:purine nucleosidase
LKRLVIVGGAISAPGDMTPVAEYKIWADPEAARIVLNADVDKILAPLDARQGVGGAAAVLTRDAIVDLAATSADNPVIVMIEAAFPLHIDRRREALDLDGLPLDGVMAAALAFAPGLCAMTGPYFVDVALEGRLCRGQTVAYRGRHILPGGGAKTTRICAEVDGPRLLALFKETMRRYERRGASAGSVR